MVYVKVCRGAEEQRPLGAAGAEDDARDLLPVRGGRGLGRAPARDAPGAHRPPADAALARHPRHRLAHALHGRGAHQAGGYVLAYTYPPVSTLLITLNNSKKLKNS